MRIVLFLLVCICLSGPVAAQQTDPKGCLDLYYIHINNGDLQAAYNLKTPAAKKRKSYQEWSRGWSSCESIGYTNGPKVASITQSKAVLVFSAGAIDRLPNNRKRQGYYKLTATLYRGSGKWWVEQIDVGTSEVSEFAEWELPASQPVPALPEVPTYPGFAMGPAHSMKWAHPGQPSEYFFRRKALERVPNVRPIEIANFFDKELTKLGFTSQGGPAGGSSSLSTSFSKDGWNVYIDATNTTWGGTDAPSDPRGTTYDVRYSRK
jgi:hypothetical protein